MNTTPLAMILAVSTATGTFACDGKLAVLERENHAGNGGAGGVTGGSGAAGAQPPSPFVLDDFEDGDTQSSSIREGYWYFQPDGTCSGSFVIELTPERTPNTHAIRVRGGGCTAWGALLGLDVGGVGDRFDASSFDALRLSARAEAGSVTTVSVSLLNPLHFDAPIELATNWQDFLLPLGDFTFKDTGVEEPFDPSSLTHLQFFVFSAEPFDVWLDDLAFVRTE